MTRPRHPKNKHISNGRVADLYLWSERRRIPVLRALMNVLLGTHVSCPLPERLFLPHPYGIIVGSPVELENDVVLMQQVTIGGKDPFETRDLAVLFPKLKEGVYVGAGARILGPITIGAWAIVGANAVVTKDVPPGATVVGFNRIIPAHPPPGSESAKPEPLR